MDRITDGSYIKNIERCKKVIEEQSAKIRLLTDLARAGSWVINFAPDGTVTSVQWGDGFRRMLGYTDINDFPDELDSFLRGIYPEDRGIFPEVITAGGLDEKILNNEGYEFRFCRKDNTVRWYRAMGRLTRNEQGVPLRYNGVTIDITKLKEHGALYFALQKETASLDTMHEMLGSGKWSMDFNESGVITRVSWSDEFRRMLGYHGPEDFPDVLESWSDLLHPDDKESVLKEFHETISDYSGEKTYDVEYRLLTKNRGYRWYRAVGKPTRRPDGSPITYLGVFIDITERKEMIRRLAEQREDLSKALEEANRANKAKTLFLSSMSHEIRTPMNAIIGLDTIALHDPSISETTREYLNKISASAHHLLNIINDILDMSRIDSGRMVIKQEEFSLSKMLAQVNAIISGQCSDKGLHYEYRMKGREGSCFIGDEMKLRQVLINVLGNAVKFTMKGGTVTFTVEETARFGGKATLRFLVSDTGIGISEDYLPFIFDAFSQEDSSSTNKYGSTGLGMAISKSIVELMNGQISVKSEKGKGTAFTVTVTLPESEQKIPEETSSPSPREKKAELTDEISKLVGRRVLLAEDIAVNAEIIIMLLSMKKMEVDHALNGRIAVEKFAEHDPGYYDAVLMDMRMPEMDGLEATKRIRAMEREDAKTVPIIALTANAFDKDVKKSMQAGLNAHLTKPVEPDMLFKMLEDLIQK